MTFGYAIVIMTCKLYYLALYVLPMHSNGLMEYLVEMYLVKFSSSASVIKRLFLLFPYINFTVLL